MLSNPNPLLNEEERALLKDKPEECFRRAVDRGVFSLEEITADLDPRIAQVLQCIVSGERLPPPPEGTEPQWSRRLPSPRESAGEEVERSGIELPPERPIDSWTQHALQVHPLLLEWLESRLVGPDEAMEAAHTIDKRLGRYTTGTRYAVP